MFDCKGRLNESGLILNYKKADTIQFYNHYERAAKKEIRNMNHLDEWIIENGKHTFYYPSCKIESIGEYHNFELVDNHTGYYPSGNIRFEYTRLNKTDVKKKIYLNSKQIREERIERNNQIHGEGKTWYKTGTIERIENYKNGKLHGEVKYFYENGILESHSSYKKGILNDSIKSYYNSGKLSDLGFYKNGKEQGTYIAFHENGKLKLKYNYEQGIMIGTQFEYDKNGSIQSEASYENGIQISFKDHE